MQMIKIRICEDGKNKLLKIDGHAMYSDKNDIVCAAVSAIYYALLASVAEEKDVRYMSHFESSGSAKLSFQANDISHGGFNMAVRGLSLIAENYRKNVSFRIERKKQK